MKILLTVSYDGRNYCGWQRQNNGITVQQTLEEQGLFSVFKREVHTLGASRTDAGVHALGQRVCFELGDNECMIPLGKLPQVINAALPRDIVVTKAESVHEDFHPIFDAKRKSYEYIILNSYYLNPKLADYCEHVYYPLDFGNMRAAASCFIGEHDFTAFRTTDGSARTTVRTVYSLELKKQDDIISFVITGNGFLYNMVRIIAGTLIDAGRGRISPNEVPGIILSKDRAKAGRTASANGLTLLEVFY